MMTPNYDPLVQPKRRMSTHTTHYAATMLILTVSPPYDALESYWAQR